MKFCCLQKLGDMPGFEVIQVNLSKYARKTYFLLKIGYFLLNLIQFN